MPLSDGFEVMKKQSLNIVIACGGTGGHLFPGIAVAEGLRRMGHEPLLLISTKAVDRDAVRKYPHLRFVAMPAIARPGRFSWRWLSFLWQLWRTNARCKRLFRTEEVAAVLGMGGFTSFAPVWAGYQMGLATLIHDSNALPGKANRMTARYSSRVLLGMAAAASYFPRHECVVTGTPLRDELHHLPSREDAARSWGLDPTRKIVVVMGGSQGARGLNELMLEARSMLHQGLQVIHIAGRAEEERLRPLVQEWRDYYLLGFCQDMAVVYALADVMVSRSGASSLTELAHLGLPSILVPYPHAADDHQSVNAAIFAEQGAALVYQERSLTPTILATAINRLCAQEVIWRDMASAAREMDRPDAVSDICHAVLEAVAANQLGGCSRVVGARGEDVAANSEVGGRMHEDQ